VLVEFDSRVALDPGEGVVLPDREDDIVAGQRDRFDYLAALLPILLEPAQTLEFHSDELPVLDDETLRRVVLHDLHQLLLSILQLHGDALKYFRDRRAMTLMSFPPNRRDVRQQSIAVLPTPMMRTRSPIV